MTLRSSKRQSESKFLTTAAGH